MYSFEFIITVNILSSLPRRGVTCYKTTTTIWNSLLNFIFSIKQYSIVSYRNASYMLLFDIIQYDILLFDTIRYCIMIQCDMVSYDMKLKVWYSLLQYRIVSYKGILCYMMLYLWYDFYNIMQYKIFPTIYA